jgi:hypothetical protein
MHRVLPSCPVVRGSDPGACRAVPGRHHGGCRGAASARCVPPRPRHACGARRAGELFLVLALTCPGIGQLVARGSLVRLPECPRRCPRLPRPVWWWSCPQVLDGRGARGQCRGHESDVVAAPGAACILHAWPSVPPCLRPGWRPGLAGGDVVHRIWLVSLATHRGRSRRNGHGCGGCRHELVSAGILLRSPAPGPALVCPHAARSLRPQAGGGAAPPGGP